VINAESPIEPTPTAAAARREKREPNSTSTSALAKGNAGMSHNKLITLSPHLAQRIYIQRLEAAIDLQYQCQSHGYFSRCHGQDEQKHDLTVSLMPSRPGDHKCQARRVEHHLKRHQDENQITAYEQAGQSQREQDPR
jgi:hypothetical protein